MPEQCRQILTKKESQWLWETSEHHAWPDFAHDPSNQLLSGLTCVPCCSLLNEIPSLKYNSNIHHAHFTLIIAVWQHKLSRRHKPISVYKWKIQYNFKIIASLTVEAFIEAAKNVIKHHPLARVFHCFSSNTY